MYDIFFKVINVNIEFKKTTPIETVLTMHASLIFFGFFVSWIDNNE